MWKEALLNRWLLGLFSLLVTVIIGCIFWTIYVNRQIQKEERALKLLEASLVEKKPIEETVFSARTDTPSEQVEMQRKSKTEIEIDTGTDIVENLHLETADVKIPEAGAEVPKNVDARVSLFGYGPYPEVPLGLFPEGEKIWDNLERMAERSERLARNVELMVRVRIKLWELGTETVGAIGGVDGVYPIIPNVAYVKWGWSEGENGEPERYIKRMKSPAGMSPETRRGIELGETPPGWTIMDFDEGLINPHTFLELE